MVEVIVLALFMQMDISIVWVMSLKTHESTIDR